MLLQMLDTSMMLSRIYIYIKFTYYIIYLSNFCYDYNYQIIIIIIIIMYRL
jgi:hypothetical protein